MKMQIYFIKRQAKEVLNFPDEYLWEGGLLKEVDYTEI